MEDKNIKKYMELDEEYFSTNVNWTYTWFVDSIPYCLDWNSDTSEYEFCVDCKHQCSYKNIYEALDGIIINKKTLRQLLLETDFDFYSVD